MNFSAQARVFNLVHLYAYSIPIATFFDFHSQMVKNPSQKFSRIDFANYNSTAGLVSEMAVAPSACTNIHVRTWDSGRQV